MNPALKYYEKDGMVIYDIRGNESCFGTPITDSDTDLFSHIQWNDADTDREIEFPHKFFNGDLADPAMKEAFEEMNSESIGDGVVKAFKDLADICKKRFT